MVRKAKGKQLELLIDDIIVNPFAILVAIASGYFFHRYSEEYWFWLMLITIICYYILIHIIRRKINSN